MTNRKTIVLALAGIAVMAVGDGDFSSRVTWTVTSGMVCALFALARALSASARRTDL